MVVVIRISSRETETESRRFAVYRKAAVLKAIRRANRTPPWSDESRACVQGETRELGRAIFLLGEELPDTRVKPVDKLSPGFRRRLQYSEEPSAEELPRKRNTKKAELTRYLEMSL
jgi:hypothetical protein